METDTRVKSKPYYESIAANDKADFYLFIGELDQSTHLQTLFDDCPGSKKEIVTFHLNELSQKTDSITLSVCPSLLSELFSILPVSSVLYISGTEAFLWDVQTLAIDAGLLPEQINLIAPTSLARRVFCTHCYHVMENITHTPVVCEGCGLPLLVRDHFSRCHSAYVGLNINAEDAGDIPAKRGFE